MSNVRVDTKKNRIYITIGRIADEKEMAAIVKKIQMECALLKPGFTCLTDLRDYEIQDDVFEKYIKRAQEILVAAGMYKVVRVRRKMGTLAHFQFDNASYEVGYHADSVIDLDEAERLLDSEAAKRDGK
ncbi:MAG: hypothetical protein GXP53_01305 [Deltaproteobacteria bacterium]|nr:hypothetical protein [Deltaproteobacteria bacterium]